jgi:hypothetical protein
MYIIDITRNKNKCMGNIDITGNKGWVLLILQEIKKKCMSIVDIPGNKKNAWALLISQGKKCMSFIDITGNKGLVLLIPIPYFL